MTYKYTTVRIQRKEALWVTQYLKEPYLLEAMDFSSYVLNVQRIL